MKTRKLIATLRTLLDTEKEGTELSYNIQNLMTDDNKLMEHPRKTTEFNMSLKNGSYKDLLNTAKRRQTRLKFQ